MVQLDWSQGLTKLPNPPSLKKEHKKKWKNSKQNRGTHFACPQQTPGLFLSCGATSKLDAWRGSRRPLRPHPGSEF